MYPSSLDLLDPTIDKTLSGHPERFLEMVAAFKIVPDWIIIDEIQKVPKLLDVVHKLIFEKKINLHYLAHLPENSGGIRRISRLGELLVFICIPFQGLFGSGGAIEHRNHKLHHDCQESRQQLKKCGKIFLNPG